MTDPMSRIADALELLALGAQLTCREATMLRERIKARHAAAQQTPGDEAASTVTDASSRSNRVAPSGGDSGHLSAPQTADVRGSELRSGDHVLAIRHASGTPMCDVGFPATVRRVTADDVVFEDNDTTPPDCLYRVRLPRPESTPETSYVSGSKLRIGDVLADGRRVVSIDAERWPVVESGTRLTPERVYYVRLPRPDACLAAKPLKPAPVVGGEGIARVDGLCITVAYGAGSYVWTAHNEGEAASVAASINAAHAHVTRELRERCERAEQMWHDVRLDKFEANECLEAANDRCKRAEAERDEARAAFNAVADERDRAKLDLDAAVKRAELAERVVLSLRVWLHTDEHLDGPLHRALRDYDAARKDGGK